MSLPVGISFIDFKFNLYKEEKLILNKDEVYSPILVVLINNCGRLIFGYVVNKRLQESPLKNPELKIDLKGNIEMQKILIANPVNISNIIFTNQLPIVTKIIEKEKKPEISGLSIFENKNLANAENKNSVGSFGNNNNFNFNLNDKNSNFIQPKKIEKIEILLNPVIKPDQKQIQKETEEKLKGIILKDNFPDEKNINKKIDNINIPPAIFNNNDSTFSIINDKDNKPKNTQIEFNKTLRKDEEKNDNFNIYNSDSSIDQEEEISDSEFIQTKTSNLINKQYNIISGKVEKEQLKSEIKVEPLNWYEEGIQEFKEQKLQKQKLKEQKENEMREKFEKEIAEIDKNNKLILNLKETENNKKKNEIELLNQEEIDLKDVQIKKEADLLELEKLDKLKILEELKEKIFLEAKKNIFCNLEVYSDIIKKKTQNFIEKSQIIDKLQEDLEKKKILSNQAEKLIEYYLTHQKEVENSIYSYLNSDYNENTEYLSEKFNNFINVIIKNERTFTSEEVDDFIYNNHLFLNEKSNKKILEIKKKLETLEPRFKNKIDQIRKHLYESMELINKFSSIKNIDNTLDVKNKYDAAIFKFKQDLPVNNNSFRFNKNLNENPKLKNENNISQYENNANTKLFEDFMKEYESSYMDLKNQYEEIKKNIESFKNTENKNKKLNNNNHGEKIVFSDISVKNLYRNIKENKTNNISMDPFLNVNQYCEIKKNLYKILQNNIPKVEYIDLEGDDFDEIFDKEKKIY